MWHCQRKLNLLVYFPIVPLHSDSGLQMTRWYYAIESDTRRVLGTLQSCFEVWKQYRGCIPLHLSVSLQQWIACVHPERSWMIVSLPSFFFFFFLCLLSIQKKCIYPIACLPDFCSPGSKMHEMKQKGRTGFGRCRRCLPQRDVFSALLEFQAKHKVSREVDQRGHLKVVVLLPGCSKEVVKYLSYLHEISVMMRAGEGELAKHVPSDLCHIWQLCS